LGGHKFNALFYQYLSDLLPVTIISTRNNVIPSNMKARFIPLLSNSRLRYLNPMLFFNIKREIQKNNSTHLIFIHPYYGWLVAMFKWFSNVKLVIHSHNIEALRFKSMDKWWWKVMWYYEKFTHRIADINFFITEEDRQFAITHYKVKSGKCHLLTYGIELNENPSTEEKKLAKKKLQEMHSIAAGEKILLFNGTLDYKPNLDAVDVILDHINPRLKETGSRYKIIICGKDLPLRYAGLVNYQQQNIVYAGFVEDINLYFKGADIFINPVTGGGGIKTKLVEALGYDLNVVSTSSGAIGIPKKMVERKLKVVSDGDWNAFAHEILYFDDEESTPPAFFNHFYWANIALQAAQVLTPD